jgi:hypothetical protein
MMKLHPPVRGSAAWQFGEYELRRLLVWLWPTLSLLAIRFGASLLGMLSSSGGWGDVAAGVLTLVGKFVWETLKNNRSNVAHRGVKIAILLCCASAACAAATAATPIPQSPPPLVAGPPPLELTDPAVTHVVVCFSPHGGAEKTYCDAIRSAKKSVHAYAYSFTSGPISEELVAAQARGVDVQIIVDPSGVKGTGSRARRVRRAACWCSSTMPTRSCTRKFSSWTPSASLPGVSTSASRPRHATPRTQLSSIRSRSPRPTKRIGKCTASTANA